MAIGVGGAIAGTLDLLQAPEATARDVELLGNHKPNGNFGLGGKMKRLLTVIGTAALVIATIVWGQSRTSAAQATNRIIGTWQLVSGEVGGQDSLGNGTMIKMISAKHFMFMSYDKSKMKTTGAGSGSYTLNGNTYTEHIDFIDVSGGEGLAGTDVAFTVKVEGDTLTQTGEILGTPLKEIYKRLD